MPVIDRAVWIRLNQRFTPEDLARLKELDNKDRHYPPQCPFVDAVKRLSDEDLSRTYVDSFAQLARVARALLASPLDPSAFIGEETRFSASFKNPLGPQSVARGDRTDGDRRMWASVTGEID